MSAAVSELRSARVIRGVGQRGTVPHSQSSATCARASSRACRRHPVQMTHLGQVLPGAVASLLLVATFVSRSRRAGVSSFGWNLVGRVGRVGPASGPLPKLASRSRRAAEHTASNMMPNERAIEDIAVGALKRGRYLIDGKLSRHESDAIIRSVIISVRRPMQAPALLRG